jgi:hypothetical protein
MAASAAPTEDRVAGLVSLRVGVSRWELDPLLRW